MPLTAFGPRLGDTDQNQARPLRKDTKRLDLGRTRSGYKRNPTHV